MRTDFAQLMATDYPGWTPAPAKVQEPGKEQDLGMQWLSCDASHGSTREGGLSSSKRTKRRSGKPTTEVWEHSEREASSISCPAFLLLCPGGSGSYQGKSGSLESTELSQLPPDNLKALKLGMEAQPAAEAGAN